MNAALLMLADSRLPAGGHAHSGGLEPAAAAGRVTGLEDLAGFLRGRLATAGLASAALAAAACAHAAAIGAGAPPRWADLCAEAAARTPSPASRRAACAQGRALLRAGRTAWPHPVLGSLAAIPAASLYHPVVLGACTHAAKGTPADAAVIAATAAITGPASAAVRLLGFDPLAVQALLAGLAPEATRIAAAAAAAATTPARPALPQVQRSSLCVTPDCSKVPIAAPGRSGEGEGGWAGPGPGGEDGAHPGVCGDEGWAGLPAPAAPALDLLAELHAQEEVALFES